MRIPVLIALVALAVSPLAGAAEGEDPAAEVLALTQLPDAAMSVPKATGLASGGLSPLLLLPPPSAELSAKATDIHN